MPPMRLPHLITLLTVLVPVALQAEEDIDLDVPRHSQYDGGYRVGAGVAPGISKVNTQGTVVTDSAKQGLEIDVGAFFNTCIDGGFGVAVVPTIFYRDVHGKSEVGTLHVRDQLKAWGLRLGIGPALTLGPVALELTPFAGIGSAQFYRRTTDSVTQATSGRTSPGATPLLDYGVTAQAYWLFSGNTYVGVTGGYDAFRTSGHYHAGHIPVTIKGSGWIAEALFGFWF